MNLIARTRAQRAQRRADAELARSVPLVADLLALGLGSGATASEALATVAPWAPAPAAPYLESVIEQERTRGSFAQALASASEAQPVLAPLMRALLAAHHGAPTQALLERLSTDARADLRRRAEARARRVPIQLLFPLVFLVLPAFALLSVVPAVVAGFRSL